jgi:probable rRNA maturation factor
MVVLHKPVVGLNQRSLERFVVRAKRAVGLRGAVTVLVTTSTELRSLNHRFRGKDKPTDVLSFPAEMISRGRFAGDVAISADMAAKNARRLGHAPAEEIKVLTLHGLLHLAGYDHEADDGTMARREGRLREQLGLPVALIERSQKPRGPQRAARRRAR